MHAVYSRPRGSAFLGVPKQVKKRDSNPARDTDARYQHDRGNALAEEGKLDQAITAFRRALRIDDTLAEVHNDLGTAYFEKQWYEQAEQCFRRAIALRPDHGVAHANLGAALRAQGRLREGRAAFQRALVLKVRALLPPFLRWNVGGAAAVTRAAEVANLQKSVAKLLADQRLDEAGNVAAAALTKWPRDAEVAVTAAQVLDRLGDVRRALQLAREAVRLDPGRALFHVVLARALLRARNAAEAVQAAEAAVRLAPDSAEAHAALSSALRLAGRRNLAEQAARRAIEVDALHPDGHDDLAMTLWLEQRLPEAEVAAREAVRLAPEDSRYRVNLALILKDAGRLPEARQVYGQLSDALSRAPALQGALCQNMGTLALECEGDLDAARGWYAKAAAAGEPDTAALSQSVVDLMQWRFASGWENFEARKRVHGQRDRHDVFAGFTPWQGEPLGDKPLLVYGEQGVGDEVLYASMLPDLAMRVRTITLLCDPRLQHLFARSFPEIEVLQANFEALPALKERFTIATASGSLGRYFRRERSDFPNRAGYLRADPERVHRWRERLRTGNRRTIGLSWMGGVQHTGRHRRSLSLAQLHPVLSLPEVQWISLQHGDVAKEVAAFTQETGIEMQIFPGVTNDMDELAALIDALDLVVTVSNTTVHVAGAIGKSVLVMAPFVPLWMYGLRGEHMPWYASARLFRQGYDGDWSQVVAAVRNRIVETRVA